MPRSWTKKRERQFEHIKESAKEQGKSASTAERVAAATVNKARARSGEARTASKSSLQDMSSSKRGGQRAGTNKGKGRTKEQLYAAAKRHGIQGRSKMNKSQLQRAVAGKEK